MPVIQRLRDLYEKRIYNTVQYTVKGQVVPVGTLVGQWNEYGDFILGAENQDNISGNLDQAHAYYTFAVLAERGITVTRSLRMYEPGDAVDTRRFRGGDGSGHSPDPVPGTKATTGIGTDSWGASYYPYGTDTAASPLTGMVGWPGDQWNSGAISVKLMEDAVEFGAAGSGIVQAGADMFVFVHPGTVVISTADATVSAVNTSADVITTAAAHGITGDDRVVFASTGTLPAPLVAGTIYYTLQNNNLTATAFQVSATKNGTKVDLTDAGTGVHTVHCEGVDAATDTLYFQTPHAFVRDSKVVFQTTGVMPSPLVAGTVYFVVVASVTEDTLQVSATRGGAVIDITTTGTGTLKAHTGSGLQDSSFGIEAAGLFSQRGAFAMMGRNYIRSKADITALTRPANDRGDILADGKFHSYAGLVIRGKLTADPTDADVGPNTAWLYMIDSGAGKGVLKVKFDTGAAQVIGTEP